MLEWPDLWKSETVNVIPKINSPSQLTELRNLSCTPLFSKVLESFILDSLKQEVKLSPHQYGGVKGSSTEHFLIDTWNEILSSLETKDTAVNLLSVDFSKAFNRMDHRFCLESLEELGAERQTIDRVSCFLYNRTMSVKVDGILSKPRNVPGGSPQGSILGNFLFCSTTNRFTEIGGEKTTSNTTPDAENSMTTAYNTSPELIQEQLISATSTPTARGQFVEFIPPGNLHDLSGEYESVDGTFDFFRNRPRLEFDTSSSDSELDVSGIRTASETEKPIKTYLI